MKDRMSSIAVTALITVLITLLASSWAAENKYIQRIEFDQLYNRLDRMEKKIDMCLEHYRK